MVISLPPSGAPGTGRQQHRLEGMPFGTRGGFVVEHNFPADGEYELTIGDMALAREVPRMEFENTVIALLDGKEFYRTTIGGEADHKAIDQRLDPAVEEINGRLRKIRFKAHGRAAQAGGHVRASQLRRKRRAHAHDRARGRPGAHPGRARAADPRAADGHRHEPWPAAARRSSSASASASSAGKPAADRGTACAQKIVENLARRAFRRPVTAEDVTPLMAFYKAGSATGGFEAGVRDALSAILASPHFLYRAEAGGRRPAARAR